MKYIVAVLLIICTLGAFAFCGVGQTETEYLRIHIRANSNSEADQEYKYLVKDAVVEALLPLLADVSSKAEAQEVLSENFAYIEAVADGVLAECGADYTSYAEIKNEEFPTRVYGDITLEAGRYDALILSLGSGTGDNWWCLIYPAFCFLSTKNSENVVYVSRIWERLQSENFV